LQVTFDILLQGILGEFLVAAYVYILASKRNGTLYTGVTSDLGQRVWQHKDEIFSGFTKKYGVKRLVWYREYDSIIDAIADEKRIKRWRRDWKIKLIEEMNPDWNELYRGWGW
jgi:putative endonuclease